MMNSSPRAGTQGGDPRGQNSQAVQLVPAVYKKLRRIAALTIKRVPVSATTQPTDLVHDAWLRLGGPEQAQWQSEAHFVRAHAQAMRHIVIDKARKTRAIRHGGGLERIDIDHIDVPIDANDWEQLLIVNAAIEKLAVENEGAAELVVLRCIVGMGLETAASVIGISLGEARKKWLYAKVWIYTNLSLNQ